jgi:hypothetical protein
MAVFSLSYVGSNQKRPKPTLDDMPTTKGEPHHEPNKVVLKPFLDQDNITFYRIPNVQETEALPHIARIYGISCTDIIKIPLSTDGSHLTTIGDKSVLAEYSTEETTLWIMPLSTDYDPTHLWRTPISISIPANTLIIHTPSSLGLLVRCPNRTIRHAYSTNIKPYFDLVSALYLRDVPKIVKCNVDEIRPTYKDLGEWLEDKNNTYIGPVKPVFSASKDVSGHKVKFIKRDSPLWMSPHETETQYKQRILSPGPNEFYSSLRSKSLGCWCEPKTCHGRHIISEFTKLFIKRHFNL